MREVTPGEQRATAMLSGHSQHEFHIVHKAGCEIGNVGHARRLNPTTREHAFVNIERSELRLGR